MSSLSGKQGPRYRHIAGEAEPYETIGVEKLTPIIGAEISGADIGISLPGTGEAPAAPVFVDGKKFRTLRGPTIAADFKALVIDYIDQRYGAAAKAPETTAAE